MAIIDRLHLQAAPGCIYFSIPNERECSAGAMVYLKRLGLLPGVADLCIIVDGEPFFLECKAPGEKQKPAQKAFESLCRDHVIEYRMVDNIDDAVVVLKQWGALRMRRRREQKPTINALKTEFGG